VRSIYLQKDKTIFKLDDLPLEAFATSLGLAGAPKIKFVSKEKAEKVKNAVRQVEEVKAEMAAEEASGSESEEESEEEESDEEGVKDDEEDEETPSGPEKVSSPSLLLSLVLLLI
jgi:ATP-dependent RNA helicase DDX10/DBP4